MNCWKGKCKYQEDNKTCRIDNMACDYTKTISDYGTTTEHCKHENNKEYTQIHHDCFLMDDPPLEHFFSCYNLCKYYDTCDET